MCSVIVLLLRTLLHYAFAVIVDTTGQCFYLDVFFQLFFPPVQYAVSKIQVCWNVMA